jgi:hypothetical protein
MYYIDLRTYSCFNTWHCPWYLEVPTGKLHPCMDICVSVSRPALGPTQPPVQWVPGVLSLGLKRGRGVTLTSHPHLVSKLRMNRSYTSSPPKRLLGV